MHYAVVCSIVSLHIIMIIHWNRCSDSLPDDRCFSAATHFNRIYSVYLFSLNAYAHLKKTVVSRIVMHFGLVFPSKFPSRPNGKIDDVFYIWRHTVSNVWCTVCFGATQNMFSVSHKTKLNTKHWFGAVFIFYLYISFIFSLPSVWGCGARSPGYCNTNIIHGCAFIHRTKKIRLIWEFFFFLFTSSLVLLAWVPTTLLQCTLCSISLFYARFLTSPEQIRFFLFQVEQPKRLNGFRINNVND